MKKIKVSPQAIKILQERWPRSTVNDALNFRRNSALAELIRATAVAEHDGKLIFN